MRSAAPFIVPVVVLVLGCPASRLHAAEAAPEPLRVHIDAAAWFKTPAEETERRRQLLAAIAAFEVTAGAPERGLLGDLQRAEALLAGADRHLGFLKLQGALDLHDQASRDGLQAVEAAEEQLLTRVHAALRRVGPEALERACAAEPALCRFRHRMAEAVRAQPHELPPEQQAIVDGLAGPEVELIYKLYQLTRRGTPFPTMKSAAGEREVERDREALALDPDRAVRRAAWQKRMEALASRRDLYAGLLLGVVNVTDRTARLQRFPDAPSQVYWSRHLTRPGVEAALQAVAARSDLLRRYQQLRAARLGALHGLTDVRAWDLHLQPPGFSPPRFTLAELRAAAVQAVAPLGPDYAARLGALLDPQGGRMDIATLQGSRVDDGFSLSAPGVPAALFVGRWTGSVESSRVVVHEAGHALHHELMQAGGASPFDQRGDSWLGEAVAIFNQWLFYDHLAKTAAGPEAQAWFADLLLGDLTFQVFTSAEEGALEQAIYDGAAAGKVRTADDLDALTLATFGRYEEVTEPELRSAWITRRLLFQDPLYLVNYLYAGLVASGMLGQLERDPAGFRARYSEFLRRGYDAPPEQLLARLFGHEVLPQELVEAGMSAIESRLAALARLSGQQAPRR